MSGEGEGIGGKYHFVYRPFPDAEAMIEELPGLLVDNKVILAPVCYAEAGA